MTEQKKTKQIWKINQGERLFHGDMIGSISDIEDLDFSDEIIESLKN